MLRARAVRAKFVGSSGAQGHTGPAGAADAGASACRTALRAVLIIVRPRQLRPAWHRGDDEVGDSLDKR